MQNGEKICPGTFYAHIAGKEVETTEAVDSAVRTRQSSVMI
ncbi:hypothetical protein OK016_10670 [Vibrio chagasii]|nr:hypothetical protein [Vibrio chagasii]